MREGFLNCKGPLSQRESQGHFPYPTLSTLQIRGRCRQTRWSESSQSREGQLVLSFIHSFIHSLVEGNTKQLFLFIQLYSKFFIHNTLG